jgi:hypothetical protein
MASYLSTDLVALDMAFERLVRGAGVQANVFTSLFSDLLNTNLPGTDTSGTPGVATVNKPSGRAKIANGALTCPIINNLIVAATRCQIQWEGDLGIQTHESWVVPVPTVAFTVGQVVTGATSTAFGTLLASASGVLKLKTITGNFVAGEKITDPLGGQSLVASVLSTAISLDYNSKTANFTVGQVVTGAGGAHGVIVSDTYGTSGTLVINTVVGTFVAAEAITDPLGGAAKATAAQYQTLAFSPGFVVNVATNPGANVPFSWEIINIA